MLSSSRLLLLLLLLPLAGCLDESSAPEADAGEDAGGKDAGSDDAGTVEEERPCGTVLDAGWPLTDGGYCFRVMAANTTSGNYQAYEPPGIRIFQGLQPDIVLIQEFKYRDGTLRELVDLSVSTDACYFREPQVGGIPNGVVSRFPILEAGEWSDPEVADRDFAWARIDLPGPKDLWVVSVHLLTTSAQARQAQAQALVDHIRREWDGGFFVVGGDFNTGSRTEAAVGALGRVVVTDAGYPADQAGNGHTNAARDKPYDWVLASPELQRQEVPVRIGGQAFPRGLVFDSRVFTPLSAVSPVLQADSAASNMQHMGVLREFCVSP
jgi:endonuclease/exonuclease/phosphatase family metal-dependent hydrolase